MFGQNGPNNLLQKLAAQLSFVTCSGPERTPTFFRDIVFDEQIHFCGKVLSEN